MFEPSTKPRVIGVAPGADYPLVVALKLRQLLAGKDPLAMARVTLFVNTTRMERRLRELLSQEGALLLPRIRLIPHLGDDPAFAGLPAVLPPLRRRLQLARLVRSLIDSAPDIAPRAAVFELADSLAGLLDEMQGEGVAFETLQTLDVANHSEHWARSLSFLEIVTGFLGDTGAPLDHEARQRAVIEATCAQWQTAPPKDPILIVGSTGSRGATAMLMEAAARLPQGAVILPGFDFEMPSAVWEELTTSAGSEDHPQYRFARIMRALGLSKDDIDEWGTPPARPRNAFLSLALRPAPVTDQWLSEGPKLGDLTPACAGLGLIEAPSPRAEALAIAYRLRQAVEDGQRAALISPDRMLTRQVTAALDRWGIRPDDSAGTPLQLTAPGRFLRQVAGLFGQRLTSEALLALLKHPLTHSSGADRGDHLRHTRDLELSIRRNGPAFPDGASIRDWAVRRDDDAAVTWANWVATCIDGLDTTAPHALTDHLATLMTRAETLAAGAGHDGAGELWDKEAGQTALATMQALEREASAGGPLSPVEFNDLIRTLLANGEVRSSVTGHPMVAIWGTLEARVQGAELVILGGLNDGVWPDLPPPDPWLNRKMRKDAGLLLPERRIGLSAHDFQQAIAAPQVMLSRAVRDAEAETVPSRWLNRLTNLLSGLPDQGGKTALETMQAQGAALIRAAAQLDAPDPADLTPPATRPSPRPPVAQRPRNLSVTQIQTLIRDPFAIYARKVLGLNPLDPLNPDPDARLRGVVVHDVLESFVRETRDALPADPGALLMQIAERVMEDQVPWPSTRRIWLERFRQASGWFVTSEAARRQDAAPAVIEDKVTFDIPELGFSLTAKVDRIDRRDDGTVVVYDYKTGSPPSDKVMRLFDKQLYLEAAMVERGAFPSLGPAEVAQVAHISLGSKPEEKLHSNAEDQAGEVWAEFLDLIAAYGQQSQGYTARRAVKDLGWDGDYDHLARYGEWDETAPPDPGDVGQ